ncbi:MAG TPA: ankyrin repeat domain-containing protein [Vicinamibacterales bacterium]|jgi:hypothetical protein|nr:ankyrin repeat domain-containing protein [Vicinamibacterales bacterium]
MLRRGCTLIVVLFGALFAAYWWFFTRYFEWPGNLFAAGFGALFGGLGLSAIGNLFWAWRDTAAFRRAARRSPPTDGRLIVAAGPIRPLGGPLTSPFGGEPCVAYEYEVLSDRPTGAGRTSSRPCDIAGFALAASAIDTPHGSVRLLGFPMLDQFPKTHGSGAEKARRARQYVASTTFEQMQGLGALKMFSEFDDALADDDGIVRKDFRLKDEEIPFEQRTLTERVVQVGQEVCALGRYDAEKRALVPGGATLNRLWPGTADKVRREIVSTARSQATLGLAFFAVSHAMLGLAFYLSETRYTRESEDGQATAIRLAVQDHDVAALERAVRQGANPNARDTFGDAVLLDVREPEMAAALIRLGADVDVRHRDDADTPLIRAARMGNVELVRVLLAGHANLYAQTATGATALSEAVRGEHADVVALLRAAGADRPAERPEAEADRARDVPRSKR